MHPSAPRGQRRAWHLCFLGRITRATLTCRLSPRRPLYHNTILLYIHHTHVLLFDIFCYLLLLLINIDIINSYYINWIIYILCTTMAVVRVVAVFLSWPLRHHRDGTIKTLKTTDHAHSTSTQFEPHNINNIIAYSGWTFVDGKKYAFTTSPISFYFCFLFLSHLSIK